jgi:hypothetical protein
MLGRPVGVAFLASPPLWLLTKPAEGPAYEPSKRGERPVPPALQWVHTYHTPQGGWTDREVGQCLTRYFTCHLYPHLNSTVTTKGVPGFQILHRATLR